jgi:hypothetical protein
MCPEAVRWGTWRVKRVPIFTWTRAGGVLRAVLINPLTDGTILKEIVDTQNRIGLTLWSEFKAAYQRIVTLPRQG